MSRIVYRMFPRATRINKIEKETRYVLSFYFAQYDKFNSFIDVSSYRFCNRADNISISNNRGILMSSLCSIYLH